MEQANTGQAPYYHTKKALLQAYCRARSIDDQGTVANLIARLKDDDVARREATERSPSPAPSSTGSPLSSGDIADAQPAEDQQAALVQPVTTVRHVFNILCYGSLVYATTLGLAHLDFIDLGPSQFESRLSRFWIYLGLAMAVLYLESAGRLAFLARRYLEVVGLTITLWLLITVVCWLALVCELVDTYSFDELLVKRTIFFRWLFPAVVVTHACSYARNWT